MKKGVLYSLIILVSAINIFLLYKINKGNEVLEDKENYCLYRDRNLLSEIENLNYKAPLKMVSSDSDTHIVLRYNENSCSQCVFEAEALLEEIFGKKDMCIVGPIGIHVPFFFQFIWKLKQNLIRTLWWSATSAPICMFNKGRLPRLRTHLSGYDLAT
jgi:hypothetical protein